MEIKCLLTKLIQEQVFHFSVLNSRISSFPYSDDISDHPKPLPETYFTSGSLKLGSMSSPTQMYTYFTSGSLKLGSMSSPTQIYMYCAIIILCACDHAIFVTSTG